MAAAGMVLGALCVPFSAEAAGVLPASGIAAFFEKTLTNEEYIAMAAEAEGAVYGYTNIGIANVGKGNLNVRETPSTSGKLVGKMPNDSACEVYEEENGWFHVKSGEVEGYVSGDFLTTGLDAVLRADELVHTVAVVQTDGLNVRSEADKNSSVVTRVAKGEELEYVSTEGDWICVQLDADNVYVAAEYVKVEEKLDTAVTLSELLYGDGVSDVRVELVEYAKQFLGNPYVWGGTSLTKGADCSGFVLSVFKKFGVSLSHSSRAQANEGTKIKTSELQPGDLVFYGNSKGTINHVAIYIGGGQVIHASNPKSGIKISKTTYRTPVKCVRVLKD